MMSTMSVKKVVLDHDEVSPDQVHKLLKVTIGLGVRPSGMVKTIAKTTSVAIFNFNFLTLFSFRLSVTDG